MAQQVAASNRQGPASRVGVLGRCGQLRPRGFRPDGAASGVALGLAHGLARSQAQRAGEGGCRLQAAAQAIAAARGQRRNRFCRALRPQLGVRR